MRLKAIGILIVGMLGHNRNSDAIDYADDGLFWSHTIALCLLKGSSARLLAAVHVLSGGLISANWIPIC